MRSKSGLIRSVSFAPLRLCVNLALLATLIACSAIQVQVEPLNVPTTPTAAPTETVSPQPIEGVVAESFAESAAGLVAYDAPDDEGKYVVNIASPYIVFYNGGSTVEVLPEWFANEEFFVANTGMGFRLRTRWHAVWLADSSGGGRVSLAVSLRHPGNDEYQPATFAETENFELDGADHREELLDATLYLPGAGDYDLRAILNVEATDYTNGGNSAGDHTYETRIIALNRPDPLPVSNEDLMPRFGDLEQNRVLIDWRGWRYGPCFLQTEGNAAITSALDAACVAFEGDDWNSAANALQDALNAAGDDVWLQNRLRQQLGTLAAEARQWNVAVRHFREGLTAARATYDSLEVAVALHNLAITLHEAGFEDEVEGLMWQSISLRDQMGDYPAAYLTWAQFAAYWESADTFSWVVPSMWDAGMPQAELAQQWWDDLYPKDPSEESSGS